MSNSTESENSIDSSGLIEKNEGNEELFECKVNKVFTDQQTQQ